MATGTRLISVVGKKNCGKTTAVVALAKALQKKGRRVATIKHGTHAADADREGTDTWRHFNEGLAERVLMEGPGGRVYFERTAEESDPLTLARHFMDGIDIVICEGFTRFPIPKIEVFRSKEHKAPHYSPTHPLAEHWIALVTDGPVPTTEFPVFNFSDTQWLLSIAGLAWQNAIPINP